MGRRGIHEGMSWEPRAPRGQDVWWVLGDGWVDGEWAVGGIWILLTRTTALEHSPKAAEKDQGLY